MKNISFIFLFTITLLAGFGCEKGTKKETIQNLDSLQTVFVALTDSADTAWKEMIASDDLKLRYGKRLLQEISYAKKYNQRLHDSLATMLVAMPQKRYDKPQELSSAAIDNYDSATEQLTEGLMELSATMPDFETCDMCKELLSDIEKADSDVLMYRIRYDQHAQAYNDFVQANKDDLITLNPDYKNLQTRPLFQLTL